MTSRAALERVYQTKVVKKIERLIPDSYVRKHDMQQGWPDLLVLAPGFWAMIETKRDKPAPSDYEPNQEWWIEEFDSMSFSAVIYPENEKEVLNALQQAYRSRR